MPIFRITLPTGFPSLLPATRMRSALPYNPSFPSNNFPFKPPILPDFLSLRLDQFFERTSVHHAHHSDHSPAFHSVVHEVQSPLQIRGGAGPQRLSGSLAVLAPLAPDARPRFPTHAMHSFVIHKFSITSQQNMQTPIAELLLLPCELHQPQPKPFIAPPALIVVTRYR